MHKQKIDESISLLIEILTLLSLTCKVAEQILNLFGVQ